MTESHIWSVDRIAAANLLKNLAIEATEEQMERVAGHFARHRRAANEWTAERVHNAVLEGLERDSVELLHRSSDAWADGFHRAEQLVIAMDPQELLGIGQPPERSRGQFLRAMARGARRQRAGR